MLAGVLTSVCFCLCVFVCGHKARCCVSWFFVYVVTDAGELVVLLLSFTWLALVLLV